jgi:hypothetical protein
MSPTTVTGALTCTTLDSRMRTSFVFSHISRRRASWSNCLWRSCWMHASRSKGAIEPYDSSVSATRFACRRAYTLHVILQWRPVQSPPTIAHPLQNSHAAPRPSAINTSRSSIACDCDGWPEFFGVAPPLTLTFSQLWRPLFFRPLSRLHTPRGHAHHLSCFGTLQRPRHPGSDAAYARLCFMMDRC